jgi:hypothetical protein
MRMTMTTSGAAVKDAELDGANMLVFSTTWF